MMKPNLIFANPTSGRGRGARILAEVLRYLDEERIRYNVIAASSLEGSLRELRSKNFDEYDRLLVIGGDGMMHHAINEMTTFVTDNQVPIALIPSGTGNDFARALGLDIKFPLRNIDTFLTTPPVRVDLGEVNGRRFGAICSTGFDSLVNERANAMSWPKGKRKYDIAMLQELPRFKARNYQINIDGKNLDVNAMLIAVGNGSSYGGGMKVCPDAQLDDGLLDVMILHPVPKIEFLKIFPKVYSGAHVEHPKVEILRGQSITITGDAITYADGERISPTPVRINALPGALKTWMRRG
jgi:diacylglycerol kinase (ATP)